MIFTTVRPFENYPLLKSINLFIHHYYYNLLIYYFWIYYLKFKRVFCHEERRRRRINLEKREIGTGEKCDACMHELSRSIYKVYTYILYIYIYMEIRVSVFLGITYHLYLPRCASPLWTLSIRLTLILPLFPLVPVPWFRPGMQSNRCREKRQRKRGG